MSDPNDRSMEWVRAEVFQKQGRVTKIWRFYSTKSGAYIGTVQWYTKWRKYAFFPDDGTLFDHNCLWDIADFLARHTAARKEERKAEVSRG